MNVKSKIILGIISGGFILTMTACQKNFLDRFPQTSITPEVFFNTEEDLSLYINGMLSMNDRWTYVGDQSSDNAATTAAVTLKTMMTSKTEPTSETAGGDWSWGRLRTINYFLENYQRANVAADVKNHYAGLARYYRAIFYHGMVKQYSDVPWYSKTLTPSDEALRDGQSPRTLVVDSIMADLDFAAKNVKEQVALGTPGRDAVLLMQAKIALHEGTYRLYHGELNLDKTAKNYFDIVEKATSQIIATNKYSIYSTGKPNEDYAALFESQDLSQNKEVILLNAFDQNKNRGQALNGYVFGDYEQSPSRDLIQTYLMKDGSRYTDIPNYDKKLYVQEFENRDPRLMQTLVYPQWLRQPDKSNYVQKLNKNFSGYHQLKGYVNSSDQIIMNGVDFPVHRYAEVLLMYAEAKAELGTLTQADLDKSINLLRRRVGMPDLKMDIANAKPDPKLAADYPNVKGAFRGVIFEIRRERRVEFAFENSRFDDLMRWNVGKLLERIPEGMYFPGVGNYDMTGDGVADIKLIPEGQTIPTDREKNSLGVPLVYYTIGNFGGNAGVYLKNGVNGGTMVTDVNVRRFVEPMYYYRPVPAKQIILNPNLKQVFGWK
jgi:hypothetical protein